MVNYLSKIPLINRENQNLNPSLPNLATEILTAVICELIITFILPIRKLKLQGSVLLKLYYISNSRT